MEDGLDSAIVRWDVERFGEVYLGWDIAASADLGKEASGWDGFEGLKALPGLVDGEGGSDGLVIQGFELDGVV